ncbi:MAG: ABC transporter permease subunit [Ilumatobacter sp.]|uniref:ABC transporter permease n=1 Tax=Ilumatobacter sp. TaxID=1967498 RepID=UPI002605CE7E|nr:ABC transporter permease subunit [Ilumatobacter sp.]MDJ0770854.1 ABC transporter permease subunit [Ilumatobacter sp.]
MIKRGVRRTFLFCVALFLVASAWELYKLVGPDDGGSLLGLNIVPKASNRAMPHTWDIVSRLTEPETSASTDPIWLTVAGYAWYTLRLAFVGLVLGAVVGISLAVLMARFRVVERGLLPWVIMSQTVPLIALAPQVVSWSGRLDLFGWEWPRWASVCVLAAFLAFFPVAVGTLRGLKSPPAAEVELMQSYAASWWTTLIKLRFPAAVPHMVPALKLAATLSVVGVIVSEISTGIRGGIGRAVISYLQASTGDPEKIYAAVFGAAALGMALFGGVVALEAVVMRKRPGEEPT